MSNTNWDEICYQYDVTIRRIGKISFHWKMKLRGDYRPSSYPFVTGDSFRKLADHIHEVRRTFNAEDVQIGDIVFVEQGTLLEYLQTVHLKILHKYVLICHNGDDTIDQTTIDLLDEKVAHFFAQDLIVAHERITPIPIGLENMHYYIAGVIPFFKKIQHQIKKHAPVRKNRIFFNFSVNTNPAERGPAKEYFLKHPLMDTAFRFMTPRRHSRVLTTYKFVASPPGHAIESSRTWEAMYFRTIPIVKDFVSMRYFASLGLPLWIVGDWRELENYTEEKLAAKYAEYIENANWEALYMDFWIAKIRLEQQKIRA